MAERIIAIEIGNRITKVCETDYKGAGNIYNFFLFETPDDVINGQLVKESSTFKTLLEEGLQKNKIRTRKAVFVISAMGIGSKEEVLPNLKEKKLKEYIRTNIETFFPVNGEEYQVPYRINRIDEDGKIHAQLYAVSQSIVQSFEALARFCKLNLINIEFVENGFAQSLRRIYATGTIVHICMEEMQSVMTIIADGNIALQRNISYGIDDAVRFLQDRGTFGENMSYLGVLEEMREKELDDDTKEELRYVIGNINRILEYYISQHQGATFDKIFLTGLGSQSKGMKELLESEINYEISDVNEEIIPEIPKDRGQETRGLAFSTAVVGLDPVGMNLSNAKKMHEKKNDGGISTARKVCAACIVVSAILLAVPLVHMLLLNSQKTKLEASIASMQEAKKINDEYQKTKTSYKELSAMKKDTQTPNDALLSFLKEVENGLPTEAVIEDFSASQEGVTVALKVDSKEVAAKTIQAFREFGTVEGISVSDIQEDEDESIISYNFVVTCYYVGSQEEVANE